MDSSPFDPQTQTFTILASNGSTIPISMSQIESQRIRLFAVSINYGVQLGLCLLSLISTLLLLPTYKLRRPVNIVQTLALLIAVIRLVLLVLYFPGPLTSYYLAWTRDKTVLEARGTGARAYNELIISNSFGALQFGLIEVALILQSWALVRTWGTRCQAPVLCAGISIAVATVVLKVLSVVHYSKAVRGNLLPIPLDAVGKAAVVLGAISIFFFEAVFVAHVTGHLAATRGVLRRSDKGLSSLEILALGNGVLMLLPTLFAGLDIAAGPGRTKILPFDAGSWVQTLVASGLPLIGLVAFYRGSEARARDRRVSFFVNANGHILDSRQRDSTTLRDGSLTQSFQPVGRRISSLDDRTVEAQAKPGPIRWW
ncbi:fungal pheromone mating factor STE2 GPCR-domain-containing protein [Xylariaceae sp. FL1019]|nr:fungal pheromone mating factor STE2 GPCR-domain-containing protein [Xylariaceae sp. FL1019]